MDTKLTTKSQEAIAGAIQAASTAGNPQLEPVHVLSALLEQQGGVAVGLLDAVGADRRVIDQRARAALAALPNASGASVAQPQTSRATMSVINEAGDESRALGDEYVSTEHLLLALAASGDAAGEILRGAGAIRDAL
ncbi:Clp protease N-terminal domain-containing protein, partial [Georgenia sp. 10Sc9-8]|nr:Clp protease N-terminal domain-containing protein [Georgenia halotolerans]